MEIAVSVNCHGSFIAERKAYGRLTADRKALALTASIGLEIYPSNMMLFEHRMSNRADGYLNDIAVLFYNGNMLFMACFHGTGLKQGHFLTATHHRNTRVMNYADNVATVLANVKSDFTHN